MPALRFRQEIGGASTEDEVDRRVFRDLPSESGVVVLCGGMSKTLPSRIRQIYLAM